MQINFNREGGYTGFPLSYRVNTDLLPEDEAAELLKLIADSRFFAIKSSDIEQAPLGAADTFSYQLSISDGRQSNALSFNDVTAPESLRPLLGHLQQLALDQRRKDK